MAAYQNWLFVSDNKRIWRIDRQGKAEVFVPEKAFPSPPGRLYGLTADPESGNLYVSDCGDERAKRLHQIVHLDRGAHTRTTPSVA